MFWKFGVIEPSDDGSVGDSDLLMELFEREFAFFGSDANEFAI